MIEEHKALSALKKEVFLRIMEITGRVFLFVEHSADVILGKRGFTPQEKKQGIVLVLNSSMKYSIDDEALSVKLVFGARAEQCYVPLKHVVSVYSPELDAQFLTSPQKYLPEQGNEEKADKTATGKNKTKDSENKIIEVDFKKKNGR